MLNMYRACPSKIPLKFVFGVDGIGNKEGKGRS